MEEGYKGREMVERKEPSYRGRYTLDQDAVRKVREKNLGELLDDIPDESREKKPTTP
jgi:hypothetical protein